MCGKIDCYIQAFSKLRTDKNRKNWSAATTFRAPHKPFLLLSVLDHISEGLITTEFIEPTFELAETFLDYWQRVMLPLGFSLSRGNMAYPFYHLETSGFWQLVPQPGKPHLKDRRIKSVKQLRGLYLGAKLDSELFKLTLMEPLRKKLQAVLVATYFAPEIQPIVLEQSLINIKSHEYSKSLIEAAEPLAAYAAADESRQTEYKVRDQGFRKAVDREIQVFREKKSPEDSACLTVPTQPGATN